MLLHHPLCNPVSNVMPLSSHPRSRLLRPHDVRNFGLPPPLSRPDIQIVPKLVAGQIRIHVLNGRLPSEDPRLVDMARMRVPSYTRGTSNRNTSSLFASNSALFAIATVLMPQACTSLIKSSARYPSRDQKRVVHQKISRRPGIAVHRMGTAKPVGPL